MTCMWSHCRLRHNVNCALKITLAAVWRIPGSGQEWRKVDQLGYCGHPCETMRDDVSDKEVTVEGVRSVDF